MIAVLFGLSFWGPYVHLLGGFTNLAAFYGFVVGVLIHFRGARVGLGVHPQIATATAFVAVGVFVFCGASKQTAPIMALECLSASTLIMLVAWRQDMSLFKPLDFKVVRFYGRISYSFYLLHPLGMLFAFRTIDPRTLQTWGMPLSLTIVVTTFVAILFTTPAAWLTWRLVETPAIGLGRRFGRQPKLQTAN